MNPLAPAGVYKIMITANGSIITTNRELPRLKYRAETLIMEVD